MTMMKTIALAKENGVAVGSHPGCRTSWASAAG